MIEAGPPLCTLITGASSGLGRATAVLLSREHRLLLHGRSLDRLEETRAMCHDSDRHAVWSFDLDEVPSLADSISEFLAVRNLQISSFVHCAGIVTVLPVRSIDHRSLRNIMNVNFLSAVEIVSVLLKKRINHGRLGNIIFISSIWSRFGARGHSAYCASKAALDGYMRALAIELAPSTRVNSVLPGAIRTPMATQALKDSEISEKLARDYPMGIGEPADIAAAISFVLSDNARWLTGQEIVVDGGRTINMSLR